jgi:hypothetical protein
MDLGTESPIVFHGVEAIPLRKKMLQRARHASKHLADRLIRRFERRWPAPSGAAMTPVGHTLAERFYGHLRSVIREVKELSSEEDSDRIPSIEAEEMNAWLFSRDIGSQIQLRERRQTGKSRETPRPDSAHPKRRYSQPGRALERVERKRTGEPRVQDLWGDRPMGK